jgi:hypothetical protein
MRMMKVSTHEIINVVPVRHAFMSTGGSVSMLAIVTFTIVFRRAGTRIEAVYRKRMFVDVAFMDMMQVPIVQIVSVAFVRHSRMSTAGTVAMSVRGMFFTHCFHGTDLRWIQIRPDSLRGYDGDCRVAYPQKYICSPRK